MHTFSKHVTYSIPLLGDIISMLKSTVKKITAKYLFKQRIVSIPVVLN